MNIPHLAALAAERFARRPWRVLAFAMALSALSLWAVSRLPVHTSRQALLPHDNAVAQRFDAFLDKFGAASDLIVVLEGAPPDELKPFADELATALAAEPEIAQATARLDLRFVLEHAYLAVTPERLGTLAGVLEKFGAGAIPEDSSQVDATLGRLLQWLEGAPAMPAAGIDLPTVEVGLKLLGTSLDEWHRWLSAGEVPAALDWTRLLAGQGGSEIANDGYFVSRDGRMYFLFVHPASASEDFTAIGPFVEKVRAVAADRAAKARAAGRTAPKVGLTGLPAIEYEEHVSIRHDIALVVGSAAGLIVLLILVVVRSWRWALVIFVPMGLGVLWSLGLALVTIGHLTLITASFIAVLFGLGADYGIFTSARIAEERRRGKPLTEAIGAGMGASFQAVFTAGGASVVIFGALATVDFPGFSELGLVAAKGVMLILVSTWLVQPALYALLPPKLAPLPAAASAGAIEPGRMPFRGSVAVILVAGAVATAAFGIGSGYELPFDYDVLSLLPKDSESAYYQNRMVAESDYQAEVVIFTAPDLEEARRIAAEAGRLGSVAKVQSLMDLFPPDADARALEARRIGELADDGFAVRLARLAAIGLPEGTFGRVRTILEKGGDFIDQSQELAFSAGHSGLVAALEDVRGRLDAVRSAIEADPVQARERSERFFRMLLSAAERGVALLAEWRQARPITPAQLPPALRDRFFAADGTVAVYAFPAKTVYDPANLDRLMQEIYGVSPDATGFPATHQVFSKSVVESFTHGTREAVSVCLLWLALVLRNWRGFVLASMPLLIGGGWMLGLMALCGIRYNYANIIALPLVIALAVDYGVWFSQRWFDLKDRSLTQINRVAGGVIGLAAGTELAGLGAITLANYRGVSSLGVNITVGLLCCLAATLWVAPAIGQLLDSRKKP
ncbi:sterol transporter cytoplasmic membrane protein BstA [Methylococcus capsulatus]|uniref:sterol transporter cytoplasmic membrane protein BstA n=1 Tax=Methylococcus capsulatus TaxID=414 RepID=UPI001C53214E|nr:sterol transporter cytoplasmic membrane protein BstA [Methylococcus capsulatus]QXP88246.1 MMPL family transporter [Methylococcus capsulatus]QXP94745.1 MMPL family transporter [Methylococcus capsulatus]UQN13282.1 MMPL family transporter [Methylococcus capsulatus]